MAARLIYIPIGGSTEINMQIERKSAFLGLQIRQTASDCADSLLTFALTHNNPTVVELMCQVKFQLQLEHAAKSTKQTEIADFFNIQ